MRFKHPQNPLEMLGHGHADRLPVLPVRINGDVALLEGHHEVDARGGPASGGRCSTHDFIQRHTEGFEAFVRGSRRDELGRDPRESGVSRDAIARGCASRAESERMIMCWAMGITQHENGVGNVQTIVNFTLLRGQIGRQGAGLCPVRGHSNVQGDRTVGIWEQMSPEFLRRPRQGVHLHPARRRRARHGAHASRRCTTAR